MAGSAPATAAAATPAPTAGPAVAVRVLPATAAFSAPVAVLDTGLVVGNQGPQGSAGDDGATVHGDGARPWVSLAGVTVPLGTGGAPYARATAAAGPAHVVGSVADVANPDLFTPMRAVRWRGARPVPVPSLDPVSAEAQAVNRAGDVLVGRQFGSSLTLAAADGTTTAVTGPGTYLTGYGVNAAREVLYVAATGGSAGRANFVVWRDGVATPLPGAASGPQQLRLCGSGITESGYVVRSFIDTSPTPPAYRVVLRGRSGADVVLSDPAVEQADVCGGSGRRVNEAGHVAGAVWPLPDGSGTTGPRRATLWRDGTAIDLGVLPGDASSRAMALNDRDDVVVQSTAADGAVRSFLWRAGVRVPLPAPAGYQRAVALDVNESGLVVGVAVRTADGTASGEPVSMRTVTWQVRG
jgi:uncharacterized membrane protein